MFVNSIIHFTFGGKDHCVVSANFFVNELRMKLKPKRGISCRAVFAGDASAQGTNSREESETYCPLGYPGISLLPAQESGMSGIWDQVANVISWRRLIRSEK